MAPTSSDSLVLCEDYRQILGIRFFAGSAQQAVDRMLANGGLLVAPSGPGLKDLGTPGRYRDALVNADLAITDSALMVLLWNRIQKDDLRRVSGLEYIELFLKQPRVRTDSKVFWIMASPESRDRNIEWLNANGMQVPEELIYLAPRYSGEVVDPDLLAKIQGARPEHIVITIGGGIQEPLGLYLKESLAYRPGIHCIGAAIAFLSGDQVKIPMWADRLYLGWLVRCLSSPGQYFPRYWAARTLIPLILKYRERLPDGS